jgi:ribosomal protein L37AE/L43A
MAVKKKKVGASGRLGAGYGTPRLKMAGIEKIQRKRQLCPFCKGHAKRSEKAIWKCKKCGKRFAAGTFHLK